MTDEALHPEAFVSVLTPRGRGAIGVARVWGEGALAASDRVFRPAMGRSLAESARNRPRFGRVGAGLGDEVVAVVLEGEPPEVEVQCHGGTAAVEMVVEALAGAGAKRVEPSEFAAHAAESPIRAAAWEDLSKTATTRAAEILLEQAQGALDREIDRILALIDEDRAEAASLLDRLVERGSVGRRLIDGWRVAIAGRPNVGKSRLLNALAGYRRAIVDPTPGTTRDVVTARTAFDGWPVELADTAGLRGTEDLIERSGIERARREHRRADLLLKVVDRSEPLRDEDHALLEAPGFALVVVNKVDLPPAWTPEEALGGRVHGAWLAASAERGTGLEELGAEIARRLVPNPPEAGAGVPFRSEQVEALTAAREALERGRAEEAIRALELSRGRGAGGA